MIRSLTRLKAPNRLRMLLALPGRRRRRGGTGGVRFVRHILHQRQRQHQHQQSRRGDRGRPEAPPRSAAWRC